MLIHFLSLITSICANFMAERESTVTESHAIPNAISLFGLESIYGVVFFDAGRVWYGEFADSSLKKDAGFGLRFKVNIASFVEKLIIRFDVAEPINDSKEDTKFWFGVNHAF